MDEARMEALAKALVETLLLGGDVLEVEELPAGDGFGRRWRLRVLSPD